MKNSLFFLFFLSLITCQIQGIKKCKTIFNRFLHIQKTRSPKIPLNEFHQRALAFLMASHSRLGTESPARILPSELRRYILEQALPELKEIQKWRKKSQNEQNKALIEMAEIGDGEQIKILLAAGAEKDTQDSFGDNSLHQATLKRHESAVQILLAAGANKEAKNKFNRTPLHEATSIGNKLIVQILLAADANKDARTSNNSTPLHLAAWNNHLAVVETLLTAGANKEARDKFNKRPLHDASLNGYEPIVKTLLDSGADKNAKDIFNRTPLLLAKRNKKVVALLTSYDAR